MGVMKTVLRGSSAAPGQRAMWKNDVEGLFNPHFSHEWNFPPSVQHQPVEATSQSVSLHLILSLELRRTRTSSQYHLKYDGSDQTSQSPPFYLSPMYAGLHEAVFSTDVAILQ